MDDLRIETEPARQDIQFLDDRINEFNVAQTGIQDGTLLACFVRNKAQQILAGIYGWTWGGCCEIRYLWVHPDQRGRGLGRRLLLAAEQEARARNCTQVVLDTHSFQAPEFYKQLGYVVFGIVRDYPYHHEKIYLKKSLV